MRRTVPWLVALVGAALVVAGVVAFAVADSGEVAADFGWTAYTPLESERAYDSRLVLFFDDGSLLWTRRHQVGAGLAVVGLLVLTGLAGWLLGRRTRR